ncbi:MAG TPA: HAD-IIA family hydrolase [Nocardioidaceae bacterium]|nr:HAD-IIA family hydrolase [Nocardioidaceae bacterium]
MLQTTKTPLWAAYDLALLDLDGVVYVGPHAVPGAADRLSAAARAGLHLAYVTNNASRTPSSVADHLRALGVPVNSGDVVTSAQAAARLLADKLPPGAPIFVIGGIGLYDALAERGLRGVQDVADRPEAVVSGYHPDLRWRTVVEGAVLVRDGLPWVAANTDLTMPTTLGEAPGNGALVEVVTRFSGRCPQVAGKPAPPLFEETVRRVGGDRPLVVGDRLDTDIEGAANAGLDSLLVMTGVTGVEELVGAPMARRPTYLAADLAGLGRPHAAPDLVPGTGGAGCALGGWRAEVQDGRLRVQGSGDADSWWRVVATVGWTHLDGTGTPADVAGLRVPGTGGR